jgi:hypothetical protein
VMLTALSTSSEQATNPDRPRRAFPAAIALQTQAENPCGNLGQYPLGGDHAALPDERFERRRRRAKPTVRIPGSRRAAELPSGTPNVGIWNASAS